MEYAFGIFISSIGTSFALTGRVDLGLGLFFALCGWVGIILRDVVKHQYESRKDRP